MSYLLFIMSMICKPGVFNFRWFSTFHILRPMFICFSVTFFYLYHRSSVIDRVSFLRSNLAPFHGYSLTCIPRSLVSPSENFFHVHARFNTLPTWDPCAWYVVHLVYCYYLPHCLNWSVKVLSFFGAPFLILGWPLIQLRTLNVVEELAVKPCSWSCISADCSLVHLSAIRRLLDHWWS